MQRKKLIDPMPKSLMGLPLGFNFVSTLALAQKAASIGAMDGMAQVFGNLTGVFPEAKDKFNIDEYIDERASMAGVPQTIIFDADHVKQVRDARAQQMQQQQQQQSIHNAAQTASVGADAAQTLANTSVTNGQTALQQLIGQ